MQQLIGVSESKLGDSVLSSEIHIDNQNTLRCDGEETWGRVVYYIRSDLSYDVKSFFPSEIENIFFELLLPNTKLLIAGIIYRPPSQSDFLEIKNAHFSKLNTNNDEITYLAILTLTSILTTQKSNLLQNQLIPNDSKKYCELGTMFGLTQLIEVPTRVNCSSSTVIDHILASFPDRVSQEGVIDGGLSDPHVIYWTKKSPE